MELLQAAASVLGGRVERAMLGQEGPVREESEQEKLMRKVVASRMYVGFLFLFVGVRMRFVILGLCFVSGHGNVYLCLRFVCVWGLCLCLSALCVCASLCLCLSA